MNLNYFLRAYDDYKKGIEGPDKDAPLIEALDLFNKESKQLEKEIEELEKSKTGKKSPPKKSKLTKLQQVALTELRKIRRLKYITKEEFELAKGKVEKNRSIKMTYHKPNATETFVYKRMRGAGISGESSSESESDEKESSSEGLQDFDAPINIKALRLSPTDLTKLPVEDIVNRYDQIKSYYEAYTGEQLPELPEIHDGYSKAYQKQKIKSAITKIFNKHPRIMKVLNDEDSEEEEISKAKPTQGGKGIGGDPRTWSPTGRPTIRPDYSRMIQHERELSGLAPRGRGRPKKQLETFHIDINSHNVRDGEYKMGDGIGPSRIAPEPREERPRREFENMRFIPPPPPPRPMPLRGNRRRRVAPENQRQRGDTESTSSASSENAGEGLKKLITKMKGGALSVDDMMEMRQMLDNIAWEQRQKMPKNILHGIEATDISKLLGKIDTAKEARAQTKENLQYARHALKERLAREVPKARKTSKTKKEKETDAINKAFASKQKKVFKKGSQEAKDYMAHIRSLRRKK